MDNGLKALLVGAGTVITCIVISLGFYLTRGARDTATSGFSQISKLNAEFNESDKSLYDGLSVSGSEVLNVINKYKNEDFGVIVETKSNDEVHYIYELYKTETVDTIFYDLGDKSFEKVSEAKIVTHDNYINQSAQFKGEVLRDSNNVIIGLRFTQE